MSDSTIAPIQNNGNLATAATIAPHCVGVNTTAPTVEAMRQAHPLIVIVNGRPEELVPGMFLDEQAGAQARAHFQDCGVSPTFDLRHLLDWSSEERTAVLGFIARLDFPYTARSREEGIISDLFSAVVELIPNTENIERCIAAINAAVQVAALKHADAAPLAAERIAGRLHERGIRGYTVAALTKNICQAAALLQPARECSDEIFLRVQEIFPDSSCDADLVVPSGWSLDINGVKRAGAADYAIPAPLIITRKLCDLTEGVEWLEVSWKQGTNWKSRLVRRNQMANGRSIVELAAYGLTVTTNNAAETVQYLADFETCNAEQLPLSLVTLQMGWQGRNGEAGFLWGDQQLVAENTTQITFQGRDDGDAQLAAGFHARGTMAGWSQALQPIASFPRVIIAVYTAFVSPLLKILGSPNFVLSYAGRTSLGKTTTLRIAASLFGCPDERQPDAAIGTWDATRTWNERALAARPDLPFIMDDTKRSRKIEDIAQAIYDVTSGRGRGRASLVGTQATATFRTAMITSGEAPLTSFTQDGGTRARVLEVWGSPFEHADLTTAGIVNAVNNGVLENYGHAGPAFVAFIIRNRGQWDEWRQDYQRLRQHYEQRAGDNSVAGRMAANFAAIHFAGTLAHHALELPWPNDDVVGAMWSDLTSDTHEADRALVALQYVLNWAQGHQTQFFTSRSGAVCPSAGWVGRRNSGEYVGFLTNRIDEILSEGGFEPVPIRRMWKDRDWLMVSPGKTVLKTRMGGETSAWLVAIRWQTVCDVMGVDDPDDSRPGGYGSAGS